MSQFCVNYYQNHWICMFSLNTSDQHFVSDLMQMTKRHAIRSKKLMMYSNKWVIFQKFIQQIFKKKNFFYIIALVYVFGTYFFKCKLLIGLITFLRSSLCFFRSWSRCLLYFDFFSMVNDICVLPKRPFVAWSWSLEFLKRSPKLFLQYQKMQLVKEFI